mgnify:CR=1 FL=1
MSQFFMAILIIVFGGLGALILARQAKLMKIIAVFSLSAGCLLGVIDTTSKLMGSGIYTASFGFLKAFSIPSSNILPYIEDWKQQEW